MLIQITLNGYWLPIQCPDQLNLSVLMYLGSEPLPSSVCNANKPTYIYI